MRKLLIGLGVTSLGVGALLLACSSDDPATSSTTDAGVDTGTSITPQDSGSVTVDAGSDGGPTCQTCSDFLENGPGAVPACDNNGPPSSKTLIDDWFTNCVCNKDAGPSCASECATTCSTFAAPGDACQTCFSSVCSTSLAACSADGADAGKH